jgi:hypothetical protein
VRVLTIPALRRHGCGRRTGLAHARKTRALSLQDLSPRTKIGVSVLSADASNERDDLEIVLVSGDRVRIPAGASVETFRRVMQVLRGGC